MLIQLCFFRRYFNGKSDLVHPNIQGLKIMLREIFDSPKPYSGFQKNNADRNMQQNHQGFKLKRD